MTYSFESIDEFIFSIEKDIMDMLYDYGLLTKFSLNAKKVFMYIFIQKINERLSDKSLLFYYGDSISTTHEFLNHFSPEKVNPFIKKICTKLKKVTNRIFYMKSLVSIPERSSMEELDGSVIDEIVLLDYQDPINPKKLKEFLEQHHLKDMFANMAKKVY